MMATLMFAMSLIWLVARFWWPHMMAMADDFDAQADRPEPPRVRVPYSHQIPCTSWLGHKYESRYEDVPMPSSPERLKMAEGGANRGNKVILQATYRVYVQDVCVRCGDVIERPENVK